MSIEDLLKEMRSVAASDWAKEQGEEDDLNEWASTIEAAMREKDAEIERLREALDFYADPETYFGLMVLGDPPCGAFADDFSDDHGHPYLDGPRYGKTARAALNTEDKT